MSNKPTLRQLVDDTLLSQNEIARRASIFSGTLIKALRGKPVQRRNAAKIIAVLNDVLKTSYKIGDIEGLHISGEQQSNA